MLFITIISILLNLKTLFHPYQPKVVYVEGLYNINDLSYDKKDYLKNLYENYPLMIIKNIHNSTPNNIIPLLSSLDNNSLHSDFNYEIYKMSNNYEWNTDILTSSISSFYILKEPNIGGGLEFISTEKIYEDLNNYEKIAAQNMLINYKNFKLPLILDSSKILLFPSLFCNVSGWTLKESNTWMKYFMYNKVLPNRFTIDLKKNDLCIINNKKFIYSFTPYSKYLSNKGFLLKSSIFSNNILKRRKSNNDDIYSAINSAFDSKWVSSRSSSFSSFKNNFEFNI